MEEKTDGTFGLLTFVNNDEFDSFKNDINNLLRKSSSSWFAKRIVLSTTLYADHSLLPLPVLK